MDMSSHVEANGANEEKMMSKSKANADEEDRKLFIGGLSWDTNEDDVRSYFSKFGKVLDVSVKYDAVTGQPRGFGFLTFADENSIDKVISSPSHTIKSKVIDPKRAKSRPICKKVFVGGVDANVTEDEIKKYFSKYGKVEGIELPYDRQKGKRREFCFIIFDTEENADAACREPKQTVGTRECDIKKAQPQPVAQQQKRIQQMAHGNPNTQPSSNYNGYGFNSGYGGGYDDYSRKRPANNSYSGSMSHNMGYGNVGGYYGGGQNQYYQYPYNQGYENYYNQQQPSSAQGQPPAQQQPQGQSYSYGGGPYGDYWNYALGYGGGGGGGTGAGGNGEYPPNPMVAGEQGYTGNASGQSSTSSGHSGHHNPGKVARKNAPSTSNHPYHHPYRNTTSH